MNRGAISRLSGADEKRIPEGASVDEELRPAPGRLRVPGALDVAVDPERTSGVLQRDEGPREIAAPDAGQSLDIVLAGRNRQPRPAVHMQLEAAFRVREGERGNRLVR